MKTRLRTRLRSLAGLHSRWGYRRLHVLLKRELGVINHKRVYRLYREEGLLMRRRKRKRVAVLPRGAVEQTWKRGEAWSRAWTSDFMQDVLVDGRRFRTLNILDLVTRECLAIEVDTSLPGHAWSTRRRSTSSSPPMARPSRSPSTMAPSSPGRSLDAWAYAQAYATASRSTSSSPANPRRMPTSRASTAASAMNASISTGSAAWLMLDPSFTPGRRTTTPNDRTAPCSSRLQPSMPSH